MHAYTVQKKKKKDKIKIFNAGTLVGFTLQISRTTPHLILTLQVKIFQLVWH